MSNPAQVATSPQIPVPNSPRVLFILLRAMGDVLLATPAIRAFKKAYPTILIDVLVERIPSQPLHNNPDISRIIISPNRGSRIREYLPVILRLQRYKYQTVIDFQSTPGSALLARLTRAPVRVGFNRRMRSWAYTNAIEPGKTLAYAPLSKFKLLETFDVPPPSLSEVLPRLYPTDDAKATAIEFLQKNSINEDHLLIGFAPYCRRDWRMWPIVKWRELLTSFSKRNNPTWLLFAAPNERESLMELENCAGVSIIWVGMDDLLEAAALMQKCRAVVSGENGLLHLAVAAEVPTFSIFCGRDAPKQWVPSKTKNHTALDLRNDCSDINNVMRSLAEFLETL